MDASRWRVRDSAGITGSAREYSQRARTLVTETVEDEREVIWCVLMAQQRGLAADKIMGIEGWVGGLISLRGDHRVCSLQG